jgi:thiol-disulfide isomerase/thioredoxin
MLVQWIIGAAIGAALGAAIGALVRFAAKSSDKAWAFIRTPGRGALLGAVVGVVFANYFGGPSGWRPEGQSNVVALTAETFDAAVAGGQPLIVDFYTDTCAVCRRFAPKVEKLADEYEGRAVVARVDAAKERALADRYNIRLVPTVVYFVGGEQVGPGEGAPSYRSLRKQVEELIAQHPAAAKEPVAETAPATEPAPAEQPPDEPAAEDATSPDVPAPE